MSKPVHVLHRESEVEEIVNMAAIAVADAQEPEAQRARGGPISAPGREQGVTVPKLETVESQRATPDGGSWGLANLRQINNLRASMFSPRNASGKRAKCLPHSGSNWGSFPALQESLGMA